MNANLSELQDDKTYHEGAETRRKQKQQTTKDTKEHKESGSDHARFFVFFVVKDSVR